MRFSDGKDVREKLNLRGKRFGIRERGKTRMNGAKGRKVGIRDEIRNENRIKREERKKKEENLFSEAEN